MDGSGGCNDHDGHARDGRPEGIVRELVVRPPDQPHDRLVVVNVVDRQAALRGRHTRDTGVHRLRQPGPLQSVARAVQQTYGDGDGDDEDVRCDRRGPASPVLPLAPPPPPHSTGQPQVITGHRYDACRIGTFDGPPRNTQMAKRNDRRTMKWRSGRKKKKKKTRSRYTHINYRHPRFVGNICYSR